MTREAFYGTTPREFHQLVELKRAEDRKADWRAALVAWSVFKVNMGKKMKKGPEVFLPQDKPKPKRDWRTLLKKIEILNAAFGGRDLRKEKHG